MSALILPRRLRQQPQYPAKAITNAYFAWYPAMGSRSATDGQVRFSDINVFNLGGQYAFDSGKYLTFADYETFINSGDYQSVTLELTLTASNNGFLFHTGNRINIGIGIEGIPSGELGVSYYDGAAFRVASTTNYQIGKKYVLHCLIEPTGISFWLNDVLMGGAGGGSVSYAAGRGANIGRCVWASLNGADFILHGFWLSRNKADTRVLRENPWQIFKTPPRYLFSDAGGGGGATAYTLACAVGAYTTSGKAATLGLARKLVCATGAYTTSGKATTLTVARKLALEVGAYTTSGKAATLTYVPGAGPVTYTLTCDVGSYAISGKALTLTVNRKLSCAVGAYTTSGKAATLTVAHSLQCATGNYTVSGKATTLTYVSLGPITYTLTCNKGSYVVSGKAATLTYTSTIINTSEPEYTIYIRARKFKNKSNNRTFVKTLDKRTFKVNS